MAKNHNKPAPVGEQRKISDKSLANLKPFKPGVSGNPAGRAKGSINIWDRIRRELRAKVKKGPHEGRRFADLVAKSFVKEAVRGKWPQMKELLDREEGKPPETTNHDGTIRIEVIYRDRPAINGDGRMTHANGDN